MWCPKCGQETRVLETDKLTTTVARVRWCKNDACRHLFQTLEIVSRAQEEEAGPEDCAGDGRGKGEGLQAAVLARLAQEARGRADRPM